MPISDAKRKADRKWRENNYDKICIQLPKGTRELWKQYAFDRGLSLAEFVKRAVEKYIDEGEKR